MPDQRAADLQRGIAGWLAMFPSANTRDAYRRDLGLFLSWLESNALEFGAVTGRDIAHFRAHCEARGLGSATVRRRLSAVSSWYSSMGTAAHNPVQGAARPAVEPAAPDQLAVDQCAAIWREARRAGPKTASLVALLMFDGFATNTALALEAPQLRLGGARPAARLADGEVALDPRSGTVLRQLLARRTDGPVFVGRRVDGTSARLTRFGADYLLKRVGTGAGLGAPLTANALRRSRPAG